MFKVVCEMSRVPNEASIDVRLTNCAAYEFSPFQIDGRVLDNSKRYENSKLYAENFLEDQRLSLENDSFKDFKLSVEMAASLEDFRFISIIDESSLVKYAGTPHDYPYAMVFDTVIRIEKSIEQSFFEGLISFFYNDSYLEKSKIQAPKYSVKWELFYPLEIDERLKEKRPLGVLDKNKSYDGDYYQYDPHFLKFLFGDEVIKNEPIQPSAKNSKETYLKIYEDYKEKVKEIIAIKFLQMVEKDKRCVSEDGSEQLSFVDLTPRYLLDSFYKINYFSKINFQENCNKNFGYHLLSLAENLNLILKVCDSDYLAKKSLIMKNPSKLSNELVSVNCETINDILNSVSNLPELINEFEYI